MNIGGREIGLRHPPYVIAELGVNHDGSVERALELTRAAASAGADAVKLQLFETDRLMSQAAKLAAYQRAAGETDPLAMLRRLELGIDDMARVVDLSQQLGIHAIVTVFSVELVKVAELLPWDAYKTASPDIVHRPLLDALASTGKPLIVSTGASTMEEIVRAVAWLTAARAEGRFALLQCVSCYPTPDDRAELGVIRQMIDTFHRPIGYSDHTVGIAAAMHAAFAGASILEKHFTYDPHAAGPDHRASLTRTMFEEYVKSAHRGAAKRLDPGAPEAVAMLLQHQGRTKHVLDIERDVREVSRQSIVTAQAMKRGTILTRADLTFKRPGTGLLPYQIDEVIGEQLAQDVLADVPLTTGDLVA